MSSRTLSGRVALLAMIAGLPFGSLAPASTQLRASGSNNFSEEYPVHTAASGSASSSTQGQGNGTLAIGKSSASFGVLRAGAVGNAGGNYRSLYQAISLNNAYWRDDWTISAAGLDGTPGSVTVSYRIDGSVSAAWQNTAQSAVLNNAYSQTRAALGVN